jgi:DNA-binding transcriptional MocR family regulator
LIGLTARFRLFFQAFGDKHFLCRTDQSARTKRAETEIAVRKAHPFAWNPELKKSAQPVYLALVDAIASDIQSGRLSTSDRLPAQRDLAKRLNLNYATVSRAYGEAQRRGLIYSRVGQGTFVCRPRVSSLTRARGGSLVDMTMNLPPEPDDPVLQQRMESGTGVLANNLRELLRYQEFGGSPDARRAGLRWLKHMGLSGSAECLLVCPGAQSAILATLGLLARPGDVVLCEQLTYPGVRAVAAQLGIRLIGLPMDGEGIASEAFEEACAEHHPKLLYVNPTLQNPTTNTISAPRRLELIRIARAHGLSILEDDAYGVLPSPGPTPFALLAPDIVFYVTGFAKSLGAGLRVAYLLAPDARRTAQLSSILRATAVMASPLTVALATYWIEDGTADATLAAVRSESIVRQRLAREILPVGLVQTDAQAFHLWLKLPEPWRRAAFASHMRSQGVHTVVSDAFAVGSEPPEAVRMCLGGATTRDDIRRALELTADALREPRSTEAAFF